MSPEGWRGLGAGRLEVVLRVAQVEQGYNERRVWW